jgi:cytochrome c556
MTNSQRRPLGLARLLIRSLALASALALLPRMALPELRPLVPGMLDNLSAIDRIGEGVALEQYSLVVSTAERMMERADEMSQIDLATVGIDPARDAQWDGFLTAQKQAAAGVKAAAEKEDAEGIMRASQTLVGNACLGCHAIFREPNRLLRPSVHVMTQFLSAWRDINRALAVNDYNLMEVRAREVATLTGFISSDEMLGEAFGLGGSKQRRLFRGFLREVTVNAGRIEEAAKQETLPEVLDASRAMWTDGCIACHDKFRR